jgi:cytoskeleton protein RodZ
VSEVDTNAAVVEPAVVADLPGRHLGRVREASGLTVADIARTLKFSERQIDALERDDYQALSGGAFVRGFIRSYARVLKIDPAPLMTMLEAGVPMAVVEVVAPSNMGNAVAEPFMRRNGIWMGAIVVLVIAAAGTYLWLADITADDVPIAPSPQPLAVPVPTADSAEGVPIAPPPVAPPVVVTASTGDQLVVDLDDKSWIEIKDASGSVVLTGEFSGGFHQAISGQAPFQLWVGNASAVHVKKGDRVIDLLPYTREGVARLTVD